MRFRRSALPPVADHGNRAAAGLQVPDDSSLAGRQRPGDDLVDPGGGPRGGLVVTVYSTGCSPSLGSSVTAPAADGLIVSATAMTPRTWPSQRISTLVRPACSQAAD